MPEQKFTTRIKSAWNAFFNKDPTTPEYYENNYLYSSGFAYNSYFRQDRPRFRVSNEKTIISAIYNRIAMDVAAVDIVHARLDEDGRYIETIKSNLNNCLTVEANLDQTGRSFIQDVVLSMLDEGYVAIVPTDTTANPIKTNAYDILSMRTGKIIDWYPSSVRVEVYDEITGVRKSIVLPKKTVAIIESPLYTVMNEPNSVLQRLLRKLRLLDFIDEQNSSNKLNLIIQLPYIVKSKARQTQAENRRKMIEDQLVNSQYGIAYTDGTEQITQLSRPIENNLMGQIEYLTKLLYSQLGLTDEIMNGTADDKAMVNYYSRTVEPIVSAITDETKRKFLTKTARTQGQSIEFFRDPFRLVPIGEIAEIADRFTRNEILSSNEVRQIIGRRPSDDPAADELRNKNLYAVDTDGDGIPDEPEESVELEEVENDSGYDDEELKEVLSSILNDSDDAKFIDDLESIDSELDELEESLKHYASPYYDPVKAHEYYMRTRELKGRTSTSGLNDKGREAASYIKKKINDEKDLKIANRKKQRDSQINKSSETKKTNTTNIKNRALTILEALKNDKINEIGGLSNTLKRTIKFNIEDTKLKVDQLREKLKNMSKEEKEKNSDRIKEEIARIREDNKNTQNRLRLETSYKKQQVNEEYKRDSTNTRNRRSTDTKNESNAHKNRSKQYRESYKKDVATYRSDAKKKYESELARIKSDSSLVKPKKTTKKK